MTNILPIDPTINAALHQKAIQAFTEARYADAELLARQVLQTEPNNAEVLELLGATYTQCKQQAFALPFFERAVRLVPHVALFHYNLGVAHQELGAFPQAMRSYQHSLRLDPDHAPALGNHADLLRRHGQLETARAYTDHLQKIDPQARYLAFKLALLYFALREYEHVDQWFQQALVEADDKAVVYWEYCHYLLMMKRFKEGWASYEYRALCAKDNAVYHYPHTQPLWYGQSLKGKTLLIQREQGLGDEIMFGSLIPEAVAHAEHAIFICAPELLRLWKSSLPSNVQVQAYWGAQPPTWDQYPIPAWFKECRADYQLHIGRLAHLLRPTLASFGQPKPYIKVDPALTEHWQQQVAQIPHIQGKTKVGVAWAAHPAKYHYDAALRAKRKSMVLEDLLPLALPHVQLVSLANRVHGSQTAAPDGLSLMDFSEDLHDLADTAALMQNLDVIVTIDTAVAHLAAAMGLKVLLALQWDGDWRWGVDDETSYWYPDVHIVRQPTAGDWGAVVKTLAEKLSQIA